MRTFVPFVGSFLLTLGCACGGSEPAPKTPTTQSAQTADPSAEFRKLTVEEVMAKVNAKDGKTFVFDNNSQERYAKGHVPTAKWVSYDAVTADKLPTDKTAELVFYCGSEQCSACHKAAKVAISLGYSNVAIMPEGIAGWEKKGLPTDK